MYSICKGTCLSEIVHFFTASFKMGFRRDAADKMKYKHYFALSVLNFCPNDNKVFCLIYGIITCSIDIDMGHSTHVPHQLN